MGLVAVSGGFDHLLARSGAPLVLLSKRDAFAFRDHGRENFDGPSKLARFPIK
jgi:hypothetical protein